MDLHRLRHILAVADTGSFSRAAEREHISQPALSRSVAAFEAAHGVHLFDRGRGGVKVTSTGAFVIEQARALLRASDDFRRDIHRHARGDAGRVSFGIGPLLASLVLPQLGRGLLASRPGLEIRTHVRSPYTLLPELMNGQVEMIVGNDWLLADVPGLASEEIGALPLAMVARAGHPLAAREGVTMQDLCEFPSARTVSSPGEADHAGTFVCENYHILRDIVLVSECTWITAPAFVREELESGRLCQLDIADLTLPPSRIRVIERAGQSRSPAAEIVARAIASELIRADGAE